MAFDTDPIAEAARYSLREHMESQPYEVKCADCGGEVACTATVDSDNDLILVVEPCKCAEDSDDD